MFYRVAHAVAQALLTDSGCSVLYNHDEAVALHVVESQTSPESISTTAALEDVGRTAVGRTAAQTASARVKSTFEVRVSRLYSCDEEPGNVCMLLALANYAYGSVLVDETNKLKVRAMFQKVTRNFVDTSSSGESNPAPNEENPEPSEQNATSLPQGRQQRQHEYLQRERCYSSEHRYSIWTTTSDSSSNSSVASITLSDETTGLEKSLAKKMTSIIRNNSGVVGHGSTSVVIGGTFEGQAVVLKSWNGEKKQGLESLLSEIRIYRALQRQQRKALAAAIPCLRLSRTIPADDPILVLDRVGESIERKRDGILVLRDGGHERCLALGDIQRIYDAATRSLRLLHEYGVLHGDIALRNLRVERSKHRGEWNAWWIDLGLATIGNFSLMDYALEMGQCANLLPEARCDVAISME